MDHSWLALPAGICISTIVMLVGFGGGMLWMPFLLIVLNLQPASALSTSLLIQTFGTASGSLAYMMQRKTDNRLAALLLCIAAPGVALGAFLAHTVTLRHTELIIGLIALGTAFIFVSSNQRYTDEGRERVELGKICKHSWIAGVMAIVSGMLSINIGEWLVPIMRKKMFLKMSNSIATCILMTCGISLIGVIAHLLMGGRPDLSVSAWAVPGVFAGGQIGPILGRRIDERFLKEMFIFVLTLIGIHLLYNSYKG